MTSALAGIPGALAMTLLLATSAVSQDVELDPNRAVETQSQTPDATQADTADQTDAEAAAQAAAAADAAAPATGQQTTTTAARRSALAGILVRDVVFSNASSYISAEELERIEAGLVGRRYSAARLGLIPQAINQAYAAQGITTAQAILRSVRGGRAEVELLEARVGTVSASPGIISDAYFQFRLGVPSGALADNRVLNARLDRVSLTDGLPLELAFSPGSAYGTTDVTVVQPERKRHVTTITLDNYGSVSSGEAQLSFAHSILSLTGWNDPLTLTAQLREGARGGSVAYARTITPGGGFINLSFGYTTTEDVNGIPLTGRQKTFDVAYTQPLIVEAARRASVTVGFSAYEETAKFAGFQTLGHKGKELSLGGSYYQAGEGWSFTISPRLIAGDYDDAVIPRTGISYTALQANFYTSVAVGGDAVASISASGQKRVSGVLPSQRKFTVTSPSAVRGYPTSLSSGDSGYFVRTQIEKLTPYSTGGNLGLRPFAFLDFGEAFDSTDTGLGVASSIGVGISFVAGQMAFGDIYVAKPLSTGIAGWANPSKAAVVGASLSIRF